MAESDKRSVGVDNLTYKDVVEKERKYDPFYVPPKKPGTTSTVTPRRRRVTPNPTVGWQTRTTRSISVERRERNEKIKNAAINLSIVLGGALVIAAAPGLSEMAFDGASFSEGMQVAKDFWVNLANSISNSEVNNVNVIGRLSERIQDGLVGSALDTLGVDASSFLNDITKI